MLLRKISLVDTLTWMLSKIKEEFGFKSKIFLLSDGACSQNWCSDIFQIMPQLAVNYRGENNLEKFVGMKSVRGHSKGLDTNININLYYRYN